MAFRNKTKRFQLCRYCCDNTNSNYF